MDPTSRRGRTLVSVVGTGFTGDRAVRIYFNWDGASRKTVTEGGQGTNGAGTFASTFHVPLVGGKFGDNVVHVYAERGFDDRGL
ncbi:MAG: hypothetical protein ABIZ34_02180 [Candidatus Limnocylindrales bacterium]